MHYIHNIYIFVYVVTRPNVLGAIARRYICGCTHGHLSWISQQQCLALLCTYGRFSLLCTEWNLCVTHWNLALFYTHIEIFTYTLKSLFVLHTHWNLSLFYTHIEIPTHIEISLCFTHTLKSRFVLHTHWNPHTHWNLSLFYTRIEISLCFTHTLKSLFVLHTHWNLSLFCRPEKEAKDLIKELKTKKKNKQ